MSSSSAGQVRGNLDREIIRRIIRRHINEVRFCYEQQLAAHRELAGRMVVQFNIAPSGQVLELGHAELDAEQRARRELHAAGRPSLGVSQARRAAAW